MGANCYSINRFKITQNNGNNSKKNIIKISLIEERQNTQIIDNNNITNNKNIVSKSDIKNSFKSIEILNFALNAVNDLYKTNVTYNEVNQFSLNSFLTHYIEGDYFDYRESESENFNRQLEFTSRFKLSKLNLDLSRIEFPEENKRKPSTNENILPSWSPNVLNIQTLNQINVVYQKRNIELDLNEFDFENYLKKETTRIKTLYTNLNEVEKKDFVSDNSFDGKEIDILNNKNLSANNKNKSMIKTSKSIECYQSSILNKTNTFKKDISRKNSLSLLKISNRKPIPDIKTFRGNPKNHKSIFSKVVQKTFVNYEDYTKNQLKKKNNKSSSTRLSKNIQSIANHKYSKLNNNHSAIDDQNLEKFPVYEKEVNFKIDIRNLK